MKKLDMETIMICAVMAMIGTIGVLAGGAAFAGISLKDCNLMGIAGIACGIGGVLWGILLIVSRKQWVRNI